MRITRVETYAHHAMDVVHRCTRWLAVPPELRHTPFESAAHNFVSVLLETWIRRMQTPPDSKTGDLAELTGYLEGLLQGGIDYPHLLTLCYGLPRQVRDAYQELGVEGDDGLWVLDDLVHSLMQDRALDTWRCLGARSRDLDEANRQLKDLDLVRRNLLSNVTHELRTPLSSILGYGEILEEELTGTLSAEQHELLQRLLADGYRLRELINTMLDMSQITAGKLSLDIQPLDLGMILKPALEQQQEIAATKPLQFALEVEPDLPLVRGDPNHVYQIVANLLSNAVKFTPAEGRITVQACLREGPEWLQDPRRIGAVVVDILDTGIGIAPDKLKMMFTSFYQADPSATRQFGGMGLGLSLVRSLVELHGGRVWAESTLGQGSTFTFSLPIWTSEDVLI